VLRLAQFGIDSAAQSRIDALKVADPGNNQPIPVDLRHRRPVGLTRTSASQQRFIRSRAWRVRAA